MIRFKRFKTYLEVVVELCCLLLKSVLNWEQAFKYFLAQAWLFCPKYLPGFPGTTRRICCQIVKTIMSVLRHDIWHFSIFRNAVYCSAVDLIDENRSNNIQTNMAKSVMMWAIVSKDICSMQYKYVHIIQHFVYFHAFDCFEGQNDVHQSKMCISQRYNVSFYRKCKKTCICELILSTFKASSCL